MAMNDHSWENESSSYNRDWDQNRNRYDVNDDSRNRENYGRSSYDRSRMGDNDYNNMSSGYGTDRDYNSRYNNQNRSSRQNTDSYNDRYGSGDWNRNQMQSMSGNRDDNHRNDRGSNYNSGYGSQYGNEYGSSGNISNDYSNRGYLQGDRDYSSRSDRSNYGGGYTGAGGYISNRGDRDQAYGRRGNDRNRDWWDRTKDEVSSWFGDEDAERRRRMDEVSGPHRGKGPKDYQRSEDRIREDVCDRLSDDDRVDASGIQVQIQNNEVILSGTVRSKEEKRRAEDVVESISGVRNVENRLRIDYSGNDSFLGGSTGSARATGTDITHTERSKDR